MKPSHPTLDELFEAQIQILATTLRPNTVKQYRSCAGSRRNIVSEEDPAAAGVVGTVNRRLKVLWENRSLVFPQNRQFPQRISPAAFCYAAERKHSQKNAPGSAPGARSPRASTNFVLGVNQWQQVPVKAYHHLPLRNWENLRSRNSCSPA